jgi:acetyl esterase/lipase
MLSYRARLFKKIIKISPRDPARLPLPEVRKQMDQLNLLFGIPGKTIVKKTSIGSIRGEWVQASDADLSNVILYLHGGGYMIGSPKSHRGIVARISHASKARAFALDYRLGPESPFPAAVEDAVAAYRWLINHETPANNIVIAGDSAGGGLTLATLISLRDAGDPLPAAAVLLSPWTDLTLSGASYITKADADPLLKKNHLMTFCDAYVEKSDPKNPLISSVFANLKNLPPMLIQVGSDEILLDDSVRVADAAKKAGVDVTIEIWDGLWHVWQCFARYVPEAKDAINKIGAFIRLHMT